MTSKGNGNGGPAITDIRTAVYTFPTPEPEADGTLEWTAATAVAVTLSAGGYTGLGWTYSSPAVASIIHDKLVGAIRDRNADDIAGGWSSMHRACRNLGGKGLVMHAISAVDMAW